MLRVGLAGITGWVGRPLADAIAATDDLELVVGVARSSAGESLNGVPIVGTIEEALATPFDVLVEFTAADSAKAHVLAALRAGRHVVVGSSGLSTDDYAEIDGVARESGVGAAAVGNFAITAALLLRFATDAARYLPSWEIVDTASAGKMDAPSGMARELAWRLSQVREPDTQIPVDRTVGDVAARGADIDGSRVHSVRLPGHTIGLAVRFGLPDERLTISYDGGTGAAPYLDGALLAIRRVPEQIGLVRGMDQLL